MVVVTDRTVLDEQLQAHYKRIIQVLLNPYLSYTFSYSKKNMAANELIPSILMSRLSDLFELEYINPSLISSRITYI